MRAKDKAVSVRLCFVCLGNICRSPTAEAIMRGIVEQEGLGDTITIESAGTGGWHVGEKPDARSRDAGKIRGLKIDGRAQQFTSKHFERYDHVVAMDTSNQRDLLSMATTNLDKEKVSLLRDFDPASPKRSDVPDPYYGGEGGFDNVIDICTAACEALFAELRKMRNL